MCVCISEDSRGDVFFSVDSILWVEKGKNLDNAPNTGGNYKVFLL